MAELNKVIKGLEDIQKHLDTGYSFAISWKSELIRDALELLKEYNRKDGCPCKHCEEYECEKVCDEFREWDKNNRAI